MSDQKLPRILIVDDEEAILETMSFTFMDVYDVHTSTDARKALEMLDELAPVAVVISDQRMPNMTGVEFLAKASERHPETVRIMLTGFADMDATIQAINDGHVYAYINKPWEPDELKQVVKRAVEHSGLAAENTRLLAELKSTNAFLVAVMDHLHTGAIAVDAEGIVRAANRPACDYLHLAGDPRGKSIKSVLAEVGVEDLAGTVVALLDEQQGAFEDVTLAVTGTARRLRVSAQRLRSGDDDASMGSVILFQEITHEPLRRRFEEIVASVAQEQGELRPRIEAALADMKSLVESLAASEKRSPTLVELVERASRAQTAMQNWLDVDDALAHEEFPDAQQLVDRMRIASKRWPYPNELPARVRELASRVEEYYESGENSRRRVL